MSKKKDSVTEWIEKCIRLEVYIDIVDRYNKAIERFYEDMECDPTDWEKLEIMDQVIGSIERGR